MPDDLLPSRRSDSEDSGLIGAGASGGARIPLAKGAGDTQSDSRWRSRESRILKPVYRLPPAICGGATVMDSILNAEDVTSSGSEHAANAESA
jgi:hypothetical protein